MSGTFIDANIDPALHALDDGTDPAAQMLLKFRTAGSSAPPSDPASPTGSQDMAGDEPEGSLPAAGFHLPTPSLTPGGPSLAAFGNLVKHQVHLSEKSGVAFDQFLRLRSSDERNVVLFAHILELLDMTRKMEKAEQYEISQSLSTRIRNYTRAFVYSPQLSAYRGIEAAEHVLLAMRESNGSDLPPESDTASVKMVLSHIGEKATYYRNVVKTVVTSSLQPNSPLENIAALTNKLINGTQIKATTQLYVRLAFIRTIMYQYPWLNEETFWLKVDDVILHNSKNCKTKEELDGLYNLYYRDDIKLHKDPAETPHTTVEFNESASTWQAVVRKHSKNVAPNPKNAQVLAKAHQAWLATQPSRKRKRTGSDSDEDDDN
ncbi:hypothetical protein C8R45DRAFT_1101016 [Mycena sanguinolenta]|nr:hypothetical protein C8R45DRAFT_1101016 [Mycena sanguinolenta]